jgi:CRP-like cAMP-binding protein
MIEKMPDARYRSFHEVLQDLNELRNSGRLFDTKYYGAGEVIFHEGEDGTYSFIILSGKVDISKTVDGRRVSIAELGKDEIVGELAIFSDEPRSATVTALEPTTIRIMKRQEIDRELEKLAPWVGSMISGLSDRFIELNETLLVQKDKEYEKKA